MMEKGYHKILVAIDGSSQSYQALQEAVELAEHHQALLKIVYVLNDKLANIPVQVNSKVIYQTVQEHSDHVIEEVQTRMADQKVTYEILRLTGTPKKEIVNFSKENDIDLLLIGSTGLDALDRFILGSTTQYVVNHATCNLIVVK